jgi:hypothetical protein
VTQRLATCLGGAARVVGLDRDVSALREAWAARDGVEFVTGGARALPFGRDDSMR